MDYNNKEMQAVAIARSIKNGQVVVAGTGLPLVGATLAKKTYAPKCHIMVESGFVDCAATEAPTSVGDLRFMASSSVHFEEYRYVGFQAIYERKGIDLIAFIGGAEIDPFGNLNSTSIGDYHKPLTRLSGSGGANGIATNFNTIITMKHQKRRFVEKIDYVTSPGWIDGRDGRSKVGLPDKGPKIVITDLGILKFDGNKRMYLAEYYRGIAPEFIQENTGFELDISNAVESPEPEEDILDVLRTEVDPKKIYI